MIGPTLAEMRQGTGGDGLFAISWKARGTVQHVLVPSELSGCETPIAVMTASHFPTGSHKVGAAYVIAVEKHLAGEMDPIRHTLVWPSTGNYGIAGAWLGGQIGYDSVVVLPVEMSRERFELIERFGGRTIRTPGSESNVKEIFDRVACLRRDPRYAVLNQFEQWGNYRFHTAVTAPAAQELASELGRQGVGSGSVSAFVSAMGSAGTIGAGDVLKEADPACAVVAVEPVQCPTLYEAGFGAHAIEGIGDKHVTWIHNVATIDLLVCIDDQQCLHGLRLLEDGADFLPEDTPLTGRIGISGICNLLASIKTVKTLGLGRADLVVTVATDGPDRYGSVLDRLRDELGRLKRDQALRTLEQFQASSLDWILEGTRANRRRWHNQKYFTWVEQQGKTVEELRMLEDPAWWIEQREKASLLDERIMDARSARQEPDLPDKA